MKPLPGTPPMSEREAWLLRVAELLERVAELEATNARLSDSRGIVGNVLRYVLFALTRSNEVKADLCDDVQMAADGAVERIAALEAERDAALAEVARLREALGEAAALSALDDPEVPR